MIQADRDIEKLSEPFRSKVKAFLPLCPQIFVTEALRSSERQLELRHQGLSKVVVSNHQKGLAIDIAFHGNELYPESMEKWREVADKAKACGIDWGYDLWQWDKPHLQCNGKPFNNDTMELKTNWFELMEDEVASDALTVGHNYADKKHDEEQLRAMVELMMDRKVKQIIKKLQ